MDESVPIGDSETPDFAHLPGAAECPDAEVEALAPQVVELLHRRWLIPILRELTSGPKRFSPLLYSTGATSKVMCESLRDLSDKGIIEQVQVDEFGRSTLAYAVTPLGRTLYAILDGLAEWGRDHLDEVRLSQARAQRARELTDGRANR